jgi:DNA (cytosine-5)-methyltransferase 1
MLTPTIFVVENVTGVTKGEHKKYWNGLHGMLRGAGYQTTDLTCDVAKIGLAQRRTRVVMIAWNNGLAFKPELPTTPPTTLGQALQGLSSDTPNHDIQPLDAKGNLAKIAGRIRPGQKLCNVRGGSRSVHTWQIPEVFGQTTTRERRILEAVLRLRRRLRRRERGDADPVSAHDLCRHIGHAVKGDLNVLVSKGYIRKIGNFYDLTNTFNGKCRRLEWNAPSHTVDTRFGDPRYFLHPDDARGFSLREAARIQGFPDDFVFAGRARAQEVMVGNAVPPELGTRIAMLLRTHVLRYD